MGLININMQLFVLFETASGLCLFEVTEYDAAGGSLSKVQKAVASLKFVTSGVKPRKNKEVMADVIGELQKEGLFYGENSKMVEKAAAAGSDSEDEGKDKKRDKKSKDKKEKKDKKSKSDKKSKKDKKKKKAESSSEESD